MRVLVADDCRDTADLFTTLVAAWGHEGDAAYDGAAALEKAEALRPDVVLLDLAMPGLGGAEVARRLRAGGDDCPWLVAVTGLHPSKLPREDAAPFDWRLSKPVEPGHLRDVLRAAETAGKGAP
jgi:CheY-like chemotaxis protein